MGLLYAKFRPALGAPAVEPVLGIPGNRKRKILLEQAASDETLGKRQKATGAYIYEKLFLDGEGSDINITMCGKEWKLHRLYIQQCGYFRSMLSGSWSEECQDRVVVELVDTNITPDALEIALGCLYFGERGLNKDNVVSVVATAVFLQLPDLINACEKTMMKNINLETVMDFYIASSDYCLKNSKRCCYLWLLFNLTSAFRGRQNLLRLSASLLHQLVMDSDLFVVFNEMSLYVLLREWIFHQVHRNVDEVDITSSPASFFRNSKQPFHELLDSDLIATDKGVKISDILSSLRLGDLLMCTSHSQIILDDRIFSEHSVFQHGFYNFQELLCINQHVDNGTWVEVGCKAFEKQCTRVGRIINDKKGVSWRWIGFNYGIDFYMMHARGSLRIKWKNSGQSGIHVAKQTKRRIIYQLTYATLNPQLQPIHQVYLQRKSVTLLPDTEYVLAELSEETIYPLLLSFKYCFTTFNKASDAALEQRLCSLL